MFIVVIAVIVGILVIFSLAWVWGMLKLNDFSLPEADISLYRRVLIVFPHPDDEVLTAGGLIGRLRAQGSQVTVVMLTRGERGTPDASLQVALKEIRQHEAETVAQTLNFSELIIEDFGDGELQDKTSEIELYLDGLLKVRKPDLVITYDRSGLYGHPDHIAVAEVVTHLITTRFKKTELWYPSYPQAVLDMIALPEHMAQDPAFKTRRLLPTHRVSTPWSFWKKARAIKQYASQTASFRKNLPVSWAPFELVYSLTPCEYFAVKE